MATGVWCESSVGVHVERIKERGKLSVAEILGFVSLALGGGVKVSAWGVHHSFIYRNKVVRDNYNSILAGFGLTSGRVDQTLVKIYVLFF